MRAKNTKGPMQEKLEQELKEKESEPKDSD